MQVSNLNKVINFFLVGLLVISAIILLFYNQIAQYLTLGSPNLLSNSSLILLITFFLFTGSIFIGLFVEGCSSILIRNPIEKFVRKRWFVKLLWCGEASDHYKYFRDQFNEVFRTNEIYGKLAKGSTDNDSYYAAGLLFKDGSSQSIDWGIQHYSTYVLATNYIFLFLVIGLVIMIKLFSGNFSLGEQMLGFVGYMAVIYFLLHMAVDRYLYTYESTFREAVLLLCDSNSVRLENRKTEDLKLSTEVTLANDGQ